jgi:hypothetical protein
MDLVIPTPYRPTYKNGIYASPPTSVLADAEAHAADR